MIADASILANKQHENKDFHRAADVYNKVKIKYKNVSLTGHSLGGSKVHYVSDLTGTKGYAFNPGMTPDSKTANNVKNFVMVGDPISNSVLMKPNTQSMMPVSMNPHSMNNFLS